MTGKVDNHDVMIVLPLLSIIEFSCESGDQLICARAKTFGNSCNSYLLTTTDMTTNSVYYVYAVLLKCYTSKVTNKQ